MFIVEYKYIKLQTSWNELHFRLHGTQVEVTTIKNPL